MEEKELEEITTNDEQIQNNKKKGTSIASLVLGLSGLLLFAIPCGILAIIFGLKGKNQGGKGMATAGFILGIADIVFGIMNIFLFSSSISNIFSSL